MTRKKFQRCTLPKIITNFNSKNLIMMATSLNLLITFLLSSMVAATKSDIHTIYWNTTNPMFRSSYPSSVNRRHDSFDQEMRSENDKRILEINGGNHPWEYDQVNIVCPVYKDGLLGSQTPEEYIIYSVSKEEYDSCRITQESPKIVALCNRPHELMYFTITFRSFTPTPGGLEFRPGQDYYFISTSSQNDIHRRVGGACSTNNMKVIFRVAASEQQQKEDDEASVPLSSGVRREDNNDLTTLEVSGEETERYPWSHPSDFRRTFSYYYPPSNEDEGSSNGVEEYQQQLRQSKDSLNVEDGRSVSSSSNSQFESLRKSLTFFATFLIALNYLQQFYV